MRVAVAGAAGFIGRALCAALAKETGCDVVALSRRDSPGARRADLFSLKQLEEAMVGVDVAVYLVHSMTPPSRLMQGSFEDLDVILADNFARASQSQGVRRIVYLGGLIPEGSLSPHLASRFEVEQVLAARGTPLTTLRAGLIVGAGGSSFAILRKLVGRLPAMVCPKWTTRRCQPIAVEDVINILKRVVLDEAAPTGAWDVGGPDVVSYVDMMRRASEMLGKKRFFFFVPFVSPRLSRLWVSVVTGESRALVYPLIESLRHDMIARNTDLQKRYDVQCRSFDQSLAEALRAAPPVSIVHVKRLALREASTVTSVQRLSVNSSMDVVSVARAYAAWLRQTLYPFLDVRTTNDGSMSILLRPLGSRGRAYVLLRLTFSESRSSPTRQLYYIAGGLLARRNTGDTRGRLEFRTVPGTTDVLAAILDYRPRLPWWLYERTQALVHLVIMRLFGRHLKRSVKKSREESKVERHESIRSSQ